MKLLVTMVLLISSLFADITWYDYDDAIEKAQKEEKIVLVMLSREGCAACEYMKNIVFKNSNVIATLNRDYIFVHVDIHKDFVPDNMPYIGTPTFYFVDKNEKKLDKISGGKNAKSFMKKLTEVKAKS